MLTRDSQGNSTTPHPVAPMLSFLEISTVAHPHFAAAIEIYCNAFPDNEKHPVSRIRERVADGRSRLHVALRDDQVVFMALLWPLRGTDFILLDYMATRADQRRRGIGSAFLQHLAEPLRNSNQRLIMEVENAEHGTNTAQRQSRIAFYRRNGARLLQGLRYVLPPLQGDQTTEMNLMMYPAYPGNSLAGATAKQLIVKIYEELYERTINDPLLNSFINDIPPTITLV